MADYYQENTEFNFKKFAPIFIGVIILIFVLGLGNRIFVKIDAGERGVVYHMVSGLDQETVYGEGLQILMPWNKMHIYNVKTQEATSKMQVLSKNGLTIKLEVSYRYSPIPNEIGALHGSVGQVYHDVIIIPEIRSVVREVIGKYLPEELYSTKREVIEDEIFAMTEEGIGPKHIHLDAVLIRDVELPASLQEAIEKKLQQEQMALEYEFKIKKAQLEADRMKIEASGKAIANDIINKSLTPNILKEKGIEATLQLAKSPNAKVVVVGSSKDGLPLILGNQ